MKNEEQDYIFNFGEVRDLDSRFSKIENKIDNIQRDIKELHKIVDDKHRKQLIMPSTNNKRDFDWKTVGVVIGSILATLYAMVGS